LSSNLVVSISRTRDPLKENPAWLAEVLAGTRAVRLSRGHPEACLDLDAVGAVVLWTKDPSALADHGRLLEAVTALRGQGVALALQLSVTGLGGSPVEPGIPPWQATRGVVERLVRSGVLPASAIKLRYDPVVALVDHEGRRWSNRSDELVGRIVDAFGALGVTRFTASLAQIDEYPRVARRLARLGWVPEADALDEGRAFLRRMAAFCDEKGLSYSTCVVPPDVTSLREGCIDARWLNGLLEAMGSRRRVTGTLHNARGHQRADCRCTFAYDLGYSAGIGHCFEARERWCAYCYSAGASRGVTEPR